MSWYPCACGPCRCIGCMKLEISNISAISVECQDSVDATYEGVRTLWNKQSETATPFDLFASGYGFCDDESAAYPGTLCTFVATLCCNASVIDVDPGDGGGGGPIDPPPPPPPPPPGPIP